MTPTPAPTVLLTGLPSAGKSTLAEALADSLAGRRPVEVLDGDRVRRRFFPELGYSKGDRAENLRRTGSLARLLGAHGVLCLVSVIAPYRSMRAEMRAEHEAVGQELLEVHVDAPQPVCAERDVKGLYRAAREGRISGFTGYDDPYEEPLDPDVHLRTDRRPIAACVDDLRAALDRRRPA